MQDKRCFAMVTTRDQRYLHDYFRFSEQLSDTELLEHRKGASSERPTLPQCAGRALRHLANPQYVWRRGHQRIRVYGLVRPELNLHKLVHVIVELQRQKAWGGRKPPQV